MSNSKKVVVYTTTYCPSCESLKGWMTRQKIDYQTINVEEDHKQQELLIQKTGSFLVPVTIITDQNGQEEIVYGTKYAQIKAALGIA